MSDQSANSAAIAALNSEVAELRTDSRNFWMIWAGVLVFSMQLGFLCLEVGSVRLKNTRNILLKNMMDSCITALFYWGFGYAFSFGQSSLQDDKHSAGFIGDTLYFYSGNPDEHQLNFAGYSHMFYNLMIAGVSSSIVSGSMAERSNLAAYFCYSAFYAGFVYPVVAHWVWSTPGFLSAWHEFKGTSDKFMESGVIDFGGAGVVHLSGAVAAAWGAWWLGPRRGRFDADGNVVNMPNHSQPMQMMGAILVWVGWYALNVGQVFTSGYASGVAGRVALTTTVSGAAGGFVSIFYGYLKSGEYSVNNLVAGAMAGLVAISSGCATVPAWAAFVIGVCAAFVLHLGSWLTLHMLRIDDVTNSVSVHGWCGIWGCIATGLFSRREEMTQVYSSIEEGVFYGGIHILAANFTFICLTISWVSAWMFLFFGSCYYAGFLRLSASEEDTLLADVDVKTVEDDAEVELVITESDEKA